MSPGWMFRLTIAQQELVTYTEKMNRQTQQISDYEYEISLLRKQIESLETEREKDKKKIAELEELLAKAREVTPSYLFLPCIVSLAAWHSGRTSVSGRRTFPVLRSTCS